MRLPSSAEIARKSRDRSFLIRASLGLTILSTVLAFFVSLLSPAREGAAAEMEALKSILSGEEDTPLLTREDWVYFIRSGNRNHSGRTLLDCRALTLREEDPEREPVELETIGGDDALLLTFLDQGLRLGQPDEAIRNLTALPESLRFRNEFLGDIEFLRGRLKEANAHYLREAEFHDAARYSRRSAVVTAWRLVDRPAMQWLLAIPAFRDEFAPVEQLPLFADARDFAGLAGAVARFELSQFTTPGFLPAVFTGTIWFFILMPFWIITWERLALSLLAFGAGIVSAALTIFVVIIQDRIQGFTLNLSEPPLNQFIYFVAGVALREETLKLLCFVPFAILSVKRKSDLDGLVLAAMVGLGFAFKENIAYFESGLTSFTAWTRLLTANVLHFSLTGIAGYYLVRMIRQKFHGMEAFLFCFIAVVFAHGIYNSVIAVPFLSSYSPLSVIFVAAMAYQFFDPLRDRMETQGLSQRASPLGMFVIGAALLACGLMITCAWVTPFRYALGVFASSVAGLIPLAFAYISRFRDL